MSSPSLPLPNNPGQHRWLVSAVRTWCSRARGKWVGRGHWPPLVLANACLIGERLGGATGYEEALLSANGCLLKLEGMGARERLAGHPQPCTCLSCLSAPPPQCPSRVSLELSDMGQGAGSGSDFPRLVKFSLEKCRGLPAHTCWAALDIIVRCLKNKGDHEPPTPAVAGTGGVRSRMETLAPSDQ